MNTLQSASARPRSRATRPSYPRQLATGLVVAAIGVGVVACGEGNTVGGPYRYLPPPPPAPPDQGALIRTNPNQAPVIATEPPPAPGPFAQPPPDDPDEPYQPRPPATVVLPPPEPRPPRPRPQPPTPHPPEPNPAGGLGTSFQGG
jgi:hypothetical protein